MRCTRSRVPETETRRQSITGTRCPFARAPNRKLNDKKSRAPSNVCVKPCLSALSNERVDTRHTMPLQAPTTSCAESSPFEMHAIRLADYLNRRIPTSILVHFSRHKHCCGDGEINGINYTCPGEGRHGEAPGNEAKEKQYEFDCEYARAWRRTWTAKAGNARRAYCPSRSDLIRG